MRHGLQPLIELEVADVLGAERHERTKVRIGYGNGSPLRLLKTQVDDIPLSVPLTEGFSEGVTPLRELLSNDPRTQAADRTGALRGDYGGLGQGHLLPQGGCPGGRDRLAVRYLPLGGEPHLPRARWPDQGVPGRPKDGSRYPFLYLDATYLHGRLGKTLKVCSQAVVMAMGVSADGRRELLGLQVADNESEPFWREFLSGLKQRGLTGIRLVVSVGEAFPVGVVHVGACTRPRP